MVQWTDCQNLCIQEEKKRGGGVNKPVNFSMRVCVSLNVNETDIVVVKNTNSDIISTPHLVTR